MSPRIPEHSEHNGSRRAAVDHAEQLLARTCEHARDEYWLRVARYLQVRPSAALRQLANARATDIVPGDKYNERGVGETLLASQAD